MSPLTKMQRKAHDAMDYSVPLNAAQLADILGTSEQGAVRTASSLVDRGEVTKTRRNGRVAYLKARHA